MIAPTKMPARTAPIVGGASLSSGVLATSGATSAAAACPWTSIVPCIHGCGWQKNVNVPGESNVSVTDSPPFTKPVSKAPWLGVAVCEILPVFVNLIAWPA